MSWLTRQASRKVRARFILDGITMKKTYTTQEVIDVLKEQFPNLTYAQIRQLINDYIAEHQLDEDLA